MPYVQENRLAQIYTPLGDDVLQLRTLSGQEALSRLFHFDLELFSTEPAIDFAEMIGQPVSVAVATEADAEPRVFHGIVSRFSHMHKEDEFYFYRAEIVPWLWLLTRRAGCRIFEEKTVGEIATAIFGELGLPDHKIDIDSGRHPTHLHCVQYRETDLNFLSRRFEQEGLFYFFDHEKERHVLTLTEAVKQASVCPEHSKPMVYSAADDDDVAAEKRITNWTKDQELHPGITAIGDFHYHDPLTELLSESTTTVALGENDRFRVYDYPDGYAKMKGEAEEKSGLGDQWAEVRMREEEAAAIVFRGKSSCPDFRAGLAFDLRGHFTDNDKYLLTAVSHHVHQPITVALGQGGDKGSYQNGFSCIPMATPYAPPRVTPKPIVQGPQTAIVVSDESEAAGDLANDPTARVKVRFHWSPEGDKGKEFSCWTRVSQGWGGAGWGIQFHPRNGHEVIVDFLEGDPDCPIITGRVYNGVNETPYASGTQNGIKTRSHPDGGADNYNEIQFEDKTGEENLLVHAEKDHTIEVENDENESVGHDQSVDVANNRTDSVGVDETRSVGANRKRSVGANEDVTVGANRTHTVAVNEAITVGAAQEFTVGGFRAITVGLHQETNIGVSHSESVGTDHDVTVGKDQKLKVGKNRSMAVGDDLQEKVGKNWVHQSGKKIAIDAGDEILIKTGKATILMKKNGDIAIQGNKITVKGSGDIVMKAKNIKQN